MLTKPQEVNDKDIKVIIEDDENHTTDEFDPKVARIKSTWQKFSNESQNIVHKIGLSPVDIAAINDSFNLRTIYLLDQSDASIKNFLNKRGVEDFIVYEIDDKHTVLFAVELLIMELMKDTTNMIAISSRHFLKIMSVRFSMLGMKVVEAVEGEFRLAKPQPTEADPVDEVESQRIKRKVDRKMKDLKEAVEIKPFKSSPQTIAEIGELSVPESGKRKLTGNFKSKFASSDVPGDEVFDSSTDEGE